MKNETIIPDGAQPAGLRARLKLARAKKLADMTLHDPHARKRRAERLFVNLLL
ncbi:MAG: hypothetical protein AB7O79_00285 [Xanthobacteraceae bacterium]|jgi:hypothetical protein